VADSQSLNLSRGFSLASGTAAAPSIYLEGRLFEPEYIAVVAGGCCVISLAIGIGMFAIKPPATRTFLAWVQWVSLLAALILIAVGVAVKIAGRGDV
jgi:hypothetical protein